MNSLVWSVNALIYIVSFKTKKQLGHGLFGECLQLNFMICVRDTLTFLDENLDVLLFLYDCKGGKRELAFRVHLDFSVQ